MFGVESGWFIGAHVKAAYIKADKTYKSLMGYGGSRYLWCVGTKEAEASKESVICSLEDLFEKIKGIADEFTYYDDKSASFEEVAKNLTDLLTKPK